MVETVVKREGFTDDQQAVLHNDGPGTEIAYRLAWARTYLKGMGLLTTARGVWALTDEGTALLNAPDVEDESRQARVPRCCPRMSPGCAEDVRQSRRASTTSTKPVCRRAAGLEGTAATAWGS